MGGGFDRCGRSHRSALGATRAIRPSATSIVRSVTSPPGQGTPGRVCRADVRDIADGCHGPPEQALDVLRRATGGVEGDQGTGVRAPVAGEAGGAHAAGGGEEAVGTIRHAQSVGAPRLARPGRSATAGVAVSLRGGHCGRPLWGGVTCRSWGGRGPIRTSGRCRRGSRRSCRRPHPTLGRVGGHPRGRGDRPAGLGRRPRWDATPARLAPGG